MTETKPESYSERISRRVFVRRRGTRRFAKSKHEANVVAVLMGGVSRERAVSMKSGKAVVEGLRSLGKTVVPVVVNHNDDRALKDLPKNTDVAFIALHGRFGEDGGIQNMLLKKGVAFTGAGPEASKLAFDKAATKKILRAKGIPTPDSVLLRWPWTDLQRRQAIEAIQNFPVVVKPSHEGSSIGVFVARTRAELVQSVERASRFNDDLLIEQFIEGREMTVPVFRGLHMPIVEMKTDQGFFDFFAKYQDPNTEYKVSPTLPLDTEARILRVGRQTHDAVGCDPFSRVDIRLDRQGRPWVLEVNTIPGLTPTSLLPKAAEAIGLSFAELCNKMVENAMLRNRRTSTVLTRRKA